MKYMEVRLKIKHSLLDFLSLENDNHIRTIFGSLS